MSKQKYNIDHKKLIEDFLNGSTIEELTKKYNYPRRYVLKDTQAYREKPNRYDKETIKKALNLYEEGYDQKQIGRMLKIKYGTIGSWVKKYGSPRHRGPKSKVKNEDFFDVIDTEEKAYFLGFIMADGCVSTYNNEWSLKMGVSTIDKEIIEKLLKYLDANYKIKDKKTKTPQGNPSYCSFVSITSRHLVESLMKLGVIERKTSKESMPNIANNLKRHFVRGFFDGDGITCITKNKKRSGFISSLELINEIQTFLGSNQKIHRNKQSKKPVYYFLGGIKFSRKLYEAIYKDSTIWLARKRKRLEYICLGHDNTEITELIKTFQYCNA